MDVLTSTKEIKINIGSSTKFLKDSTFKFYNNRNELGVFRYCYKIPDMPYYLIENTNTGEKHMLYIKCSETPILNFPLENDYKETDTDSIKLFEIKNGEKSRCLLDRKIKSVKISGKFNDNINYILGGFNE